MAPAHPPSPRGADPATSPGPQVLQAWATALAQAHFGVPFDGTVCWAPRLRYRAGEYAPGSGRIRLSLPYYHRYGAAETQGILLHELCHWWLFRQGIPHRENAAVFQALLGRVGAPRRAHPLTRAPRAPRRLWTYVCPHCGQIYRYTRRVQYACGRCCPRGRYDPRFHLQLLAVRRRIEPY